MGPLARTAGLPWGVRIVLAALAFAFVSGVLTTPTATASSLPADASLVSGSESEHDKNCQCGDRCRKKTCCCAPKLRRPEPPAGEPEPAASRADDDPAEDVGLPCWANAPCGDPASPTPTIVVASAEALMVARTVVAASPSDPAGRLNDASTGRPCRRISCLDRPPDLCL